MVTRIHKMAPRRLFLREHRKAKGISAEQVAGRMDPPMERESLLRLEREPQRCTPDKQASYAHALGMQPEDLWRPPGTPSVDGLIMSAPADVQEMVVDIVKRMVGKAS
jgi:hypothetical protein